MKRKRYQLKSLFFTAFLFAGLSSLYAQEPVFEWAKQAGGLAFDEGEGIVTDMAGNVYITGFFSGMVDFNPGPGTSNLTALGADAFLLKLNAAGDFLWVKQMGGNGNDYGRALDIDALGNIYIAGDFTNSGDFNPGSGAVNLSAAGSSDVFIVKLDAAGNFIWARQMGGKQEDHCFGIAVDPKGDIYTTGVFQDTADFNPGTATADLISAGNDDIFVSKLDASGNYVWAKNIGGSSGERGLAIATDPLGNVYTTGYFTSRGADFNPGAGSFKLDPTGPASSLGGTPSDVFVSKLDAAGNFVWARHMGGNSAERGQSIAADAAGNVYITGYFQHSANNTVDFDPGSGVYNLTSFGKNDMFLSKLDTSGNFVWAKSIGGSDADQGAAITLDALGKKAIVTGYFNDTVHFSPDGNHTLIAAGGNDIFIAQFDTAGNLSWAKSMGGTGDDQGLAITTDAAGGNIYSTGYFNNTADFNPDTSIFNLTAVAYADIYIQKLHQCLPTTGRITATACKSYLLNDSVYTESGTYTQLLTNGEGCDSILTLDLTVNNILHPSITVSTFTLGTTVSYSSYQWFLNGSIIPGATGSTYTIKQNGDYTVAVKDTNGCTDTSDVYPVTNYTAIKSIDQVAPLISIYPNPTSETIYINTPVEINIKLTGIEGKVIKMVQNARSVSVRDLPAGIYFLHISNQNGILLKVAKVVKDG